MALLSNLYPPIIPSVIPGFIRTSTCKVYFSISKYNSLNDISNVQISLVNIENNNSALKSSLYPTGIKLATLHYDPQIKNEYCYYVEIKPSDLTDNVFVLNKYYKLQLRLTSTNAQSISLSTPQQISTWLNQNMQHFSEWSRSCLIRGISKPIITINNLIKDQTVTLNTPLFKITGQLNFQDSGQTDYLMEYNAKIYVNNQLELSSKTMIYDSGTIYPEDQAVNTIDCDLLYSFSKEVNYILQFSYKTSCLYSQQIFYYFNINKSVIPNPYNIQIQAVANNQNGSVDIDMSLDIGDKHQLPDDQIFTLYRSSSKDNFHNYEKMYTTNRFLFRNSWQDLSVESGIWYIYTIFITNKNGQTLYTPIDTQPIMCVFEDVFLIHGNLQFRLKFNPSVSGFKYNVAESSQITIGSKYPFVKRNAKNFYRTFSISGLISSLTNESDWYDSYLTQNENNQRPNYFVSKREIYKDSYQLYENYETEHNISYYLNPLYERLFREVVYDFLYQDEAKLFKSPTEGNILVYLSDITFEPINSLGRILYSFSATATEIDQANFDNYVKYNIMPFSTYDIVTEAPSLNLIRKPNNKLVLVIEAYGATQKPDENWILHLEQYNTSHNAGKE